MMGFGDYNERDGHRTEGYAKDKSRMITINPWDEEVDPALRARRLRIDRMYERIDRMYEQAKDKPMIEQNRIDESRLKDYVARDPKIEVRILEVFEDRIFGRYKGSVGWISIDWDINGKYSSDRESFLDLVLPPREWSEVAHICRTPNGFKYIVTNRGADEINPMDEVLVKANLGWRETDGKTELVGVEVVK